MNDLGQVASIVDANGGETKYEYEHITCQKTKEIDPLGAETISVYDARGNLIKTIAPDGAEIALEYNQSNQTWYAFGQPRRDLARCSAASWRSWKSHCRSGHGYRAKSGRSGSSAGVTAV